MNEREAEQMDTLGVALLNLDAGINMSAESADAKILVQGAQAAAMIAIAERLDKLIEEAAETRRVLDILVGVFENVRDEDNDALRIVQLR